MKQCPICDREVVSKRKDATFCRDPACRKKAHNARKEQAAQLPPAVSSNKASVVVAFPNGGRWLLELTPLQGADPAQLPTLTQVATADLKIRSGSVPAPPSVPMKADTGAPSAVEAPEIRSEPIPQAKAAPVSAHADKPADIQAPVSAPPPPDTERPTELRTLELFFTDYAGRRLFFRDAVHGRAGGGWSIRNGARAQLGLGRHEGYGLGGVPSRWRDFYPHKSPIEFGLDADVAVLYADDDERRDRTYAADHELLREVLGPDWRAVLRARAETLSGREHRLNR